ncbi:hypothetical protein BC833DRAFT_221918 [Globomyces pollinis-pini]|nr:hypothetical protein BC833DRAFT_221918 [Globomyces pollinis-pini]
MQNKQVIFKQDPGNGWVKPSHMQVQINNLSTELKDDQVLLKNLYLSLDPYMRGKMNTNVKSYSASFQLDQVLTGGGIAEVVESTREGLVKGDIVSAFIGWEEYTIIPSGAPARKIVNPLDVPLSYFLGILGMPGATAYHGLLNLGKPLPGNTVFVSGAAGAVGSVVGQIAKLKGCYVVGSAGSDDKVQSLISEFGYDAAFNYKTVANQSEKLKELCPKGIDVYYDNVGGETLDTVLLHMNLHGRLVECGMISQYNLETPYGMKNLALLIGKQLIMEGFTIGEQMINREFMMQFSKDITTWITEGKLKYKEHIIEGIDNAPDAFVGMLKGDNHGKQIIKIA